MGTLLEFLIKGSGSPKIDGSTFKDVDLFVKDCTSKNNFEFIMKPTHLSSGEGFLAMSTQKWKRESWTAETLYFKMLEILTKVTDKHESKALQTIIPGVIIQPKYPAEPCMGAPLEVKLQTIWGEPYMGVMWNGYEAPYADARDCVTNAYIVPVPPKTTQGSRKVSKQWEVWTPSS